MTATRKRAAKLYLQTCLFLGMTSIIVIAHKKDASIICEDLVSAEFYLKKEMKENVGFDLKVRKCSYLKEMSIKERNMICNKETGDSVCGFLQARDACPFTYGFAECSSAPTHHDDHDPTQSPYEVSSRDPTAIQTTNPSSSIMPSSNPTISVSQKPANKITTTPSLIGSASPSSTPPTASLPSLRPTRKPSDRPSPSPSSKLSYSPSTTPSNRSSPSPSDASTTVSTSSLPFAKAQSKSFG